MRITLESDYALRILGALATHEDRVDAKTLSEEISVTQRFTLKILHKLVQSEFVKSYKGVRGGYKLNVSPDKITLRAIIELIDGPIIISRCLEHGEGCTLNPDKTSCIYHHIFESISFDVAKKLEGITIGDVLSKKYSLN
ncbi:MAG: Rrf2 family transcriptional regulator [Clostridia bacterium]|nr:Rrf2 family transcriptional regulator [Clostridia bacterium]